MITVNLTVELTDKEQAHHFKYFIEEQVSKLVSYKILPNTDKMYKEDATFRRLSKIEKDAKKTKAIYINDYNGKYTE